MAKRARTEEIEEIDRVEGFPHPRETFALVGQDEALARAARAIRSGRPPQGWLIGGPPGIGKATLAYRIARYLLSYGATDAGPEDLSVAANDPVSLQVKAGAHPGLLVLKRGANPKTGKLMTETSVNVIREAAEFFGLTSGAGGWRVAMVDTADELSKEAANALLKTLEEPPDRAMLMLVASSPGKLLPTIRSRCQRLDLRPLSDDTLAPELARQLPKMSEADRAALAKLAGGSLGLALALANEDMLALAREAQRAVDQAGAPDIPALLALGDRLARSPDNLAAYGNFFTAALEQRIRKRAQAEGATGMRRWIEAWEKVRESFERGVGLHLEPRQTVVSSVRAIGLASGGR